MWSRLARWIGVSAALCAVWLPALAQGSCGFFDPKVRFFDGSQACLSDFPLMSRKGIISGGEFPDYVAVAKRHPMSYAIAATANPERCPFVQFTET